MQLKKFYQSRKSQKTVSVQIFGDKIPLYGSGQTLVGTSTGVPTAPVNMTLSFTVRSRAYVLGQLVKPKFYKTINCNVVYDPNPTKKSHPINLKKACTYQ